MKKHKETDDGIYKSTETDPSNSDPSYHGYFEIKDGEIVGVGEERGRDGGWFWLKGMENLRRSVENIKEWPNLYERALKYLK